MFFLSVWKRNFSRRLGRCIEILFNSRLQIGTHINWFDLTFYFSFPKQLSARRLCMPELHTRQIQITIDLYRDQHELRNFAFEINCRQSLHIYEKNCTQRRSIHTRTRYMKKKKKKQKGPRHLCARSRESFRETRHRWAAPRSYHREKNVIAFVNRASLVVRTIEQKVREKSQRFVTRKKADRISNHHRVKFPEENPSAFTSSVNHGWRFARMTNRDFSPNVSGVKYA